jgi:hypothetical protein
MVTPTKDELYAKALEIFMQEMYAKGMTDVRTPEYEELAEGNYIERARTELMKSPETRAWEEELKGLESAISQLEEARQREIAGVPAGVEVAPETLRKLLEIYHDLKMREDQLRDLRSKRKEETKAAKERISELESQMAKAREEAKKKPTLRIRILENFKEGIQYFRKGDVIETPNVEWALAKIEPPPGYPKLAERVGVEVPVKVIPEAPPKVVKPEAPADRVRRLTDVFIATLSRNNVPIRPEYRSRLRVELPSILTLATLDEQERAVEHFAMEIVNEYKGKVEVARRVREIVSRAPPTVKEIPPEWKETTGGWLLPNGRVIPYGREREEVERAEVIPEPKLRPPAANLWRWLYDTFKIGEVEFWSEREGKHVKGFRSLDDVKRAFYALPPDEQKTLIDQYRSYLPAFKYPDMETFLKVKYDMTMDDLAFKSNEEKIKLWNEYWAET